MSTDFLHIKSEKKNKQINGRLFLCPMQRVQVALWMSGIRQDVKNDISLYQLQPDVQHTLRYSSRIIRKVNRKRRLTQGTKCP